MILNASGIPNLVPSFDYSLRDGFTTPGCSRCREPLEKEAAAKRIELVTMDSAGVRLDPLVEALYMGAFLGILAQAGTKRGAMDDVEFLSSQHLGAAALHHLRAGTWERFSRAVVAAWDLARATENPAIGINTFLYAIHFCDGGQWHTHQLKLFTLEELGAKFKEANIAIGSPRNLRYHLKILSIRHRPSKPGPKRRGEF